MGHRFLFRFIGPALFCTAALAGEKGETLPVMIRQVQPEYGADLSNSYLVEPVTVAMIIDADGVPFSLTAPPGLPDNVVQALAQWRYRPGKKDGREVPFSISLTVPLRRAINRSVEGSLRRSWRPGKELSDALKTGEELDPAGAARVRQRLESDPNSLEARAILLAWEARPKPENNDESRQLRAGQIAFLVGNAPDSDILGSPLVLLNNVPTDPLSDSAGYEQVRTLWLNQLALSSGNPTVIAHAVNFLRVPDPEKTEQLLLPVVNKVEGAPVWLGDLYGLAALGVTGLDLKTGLPARAGERLPETAFAQKARSTLASTVDARVLFSALATVTAGGRSLAKLGRLPAGYADFCGTLLNRARQIFPDTSASCDPSASVPDDRSAVNSPVSRIRIGGKVAQANLIKQVRPVYPSAAKAQHIQGTVRFSVLIDKEGKIRSLLLISGPLALYESARDAVLQWVYKPTRLNGEPVEVVTVADINYEMRQ